MRWLCLLLLAPGLCFAAVIEGNVSDASGKPVPGALVTLYEDATGYAETVSAGGQGAFRLRTRSQGAATLRVRATGHPDQSRPLLLVPDSSERVAIALGSFNTPEAESESQPASAHVAKLLAKLGA